MALFSRKIVLIEKTPIHLGEVDYTKPGLYDNIRTFPLETKTGKSLYVSIESNNGVDISVIDPTGLNVKFRENVTTETVLGPIPVKVKGIMSIILGVYAGDRTDVIISAWME